MRKSLSLRERFSVLKRDGFRCQYCGAYAGNTALVVDHVIPILNGGENAAWNYLTSCKDCKLSKHSLDDDDQILWALIRAETRDDISAAWYLFVNLSSRGWSPDAMMSRELQLSVG